MLHKPWFYFGQIMLYICDMEGRGKEVLEIRSSIFKQFEKGPWWYSGDKIL